MKSTHYALAVLFSGALLPARSFAQNPALNARIAQLAQAEEAIQALRKVDSKASILELWDPTLRFVRGRMADREERDVPRDLRNLGQKRIWAWAAWAKWTLHVLGPRLGPKK